MRSRACYASRVRVKIRILSCQSDRILHAYTISILAQRARNRSPAKVIYLVSLFDTEPEYEAEVSVGTRTTFIFIAFEYFRSECFVRSALYDHIVWCGSHFRNGTPSFGSNPSPNRNCACVCALHIHFFVWVNRNGQPYNPTPKRTSRTHSTGV